ncbi:TRAP transporter small permease [Paenochrobactrum pullorum]|uniref:TRAP transporter small permease n=1 Tax=Paenochrobactrum pullorum TaxID=1324351 RepID=UPI0035BBD622
MNDRTSPLKVFLTFEKFLTKAAVALATAGLAVASLVGLYQIIARFILHVSAEWSEPLIQVTLIWMAYLGLAAAMRSGTLISVDWMLSKSRGPMRQLVKTIILMSVLTLLGFIAWFGIELALRVKFQTIAGIGIAASWAYAALPVGAIISIIAALAHLLDPRSEIDHETENS